jgi:hypothetical protein
LYTNYCALLNFSIGSCTLTLNSHQLKRPRVASEAVSEASDLKSAGSSVKEEFLRVPVHKYGVIVVPSSSSTASKSTPQMVPVPLLRGEVTWSKMHCRMCQSCAVDPEVPASNTVRFFESFIEAGWLYVSEWSCAMEEQASLRTALNRQRLKALLLLSEGEIKMPNVCLPNQTVLDICCR